MKTTIFSKGLKSLVICLSFILISSVSFAADPPVHKNFSSIVDSISAFLKSQYGYSLKLDPSLKNGCINYYKEVKTGVSSDPVEGEGHIHSSATIPMEYYNDIPTSFFCEVVQETIERPQFSYYFEIYKPSKFWVEEVIVGDKCYFIIAIE